MTDDLPERLLRLHAILHVAAGNCDDDETDAGSLRLALPFRDALPSAASLIQRLEGERDAWKGDARHYMVQHGALLESHEAAEQALSASQKEVERLTGALKLARDRLDKAGQIIPPSIDAALQTGGKEHG